MTNQIQTACVKCNALPNAPKSNITLGHQKRARTISLVRQARLVIDKTLNSTITSKEY